MEHEQFETLEMNCFTIKCFLIVSLNLFTQPNQIFVISSLLEYSSLSTDCRLKFPLKMLNASSLLSEAFRFVRNSRFLIQLLELLIKSCLFQLSKMELTFASFILVKFVFETFLKRHPLNFQGDYRAGLDLSQQYEIRFAFMFFIEQSLKNILSS